MKITVGNLNFADDGGKKSYTPGVPNVLYLLRVLRLGVVQEFLDQQVAQELKSPLSPTP